MSRPHVSSLDSIVCLQCSPPGIAHALSTPFATPPPPPPLGSGGELGAIPYLCRRAVVASTWVATTQTVVASCPHSRRRPPGHCSPSSMMSRPHVSSLDSIVCLQCSPPGIAHALSTSFATPPPSEPSPTYVDGRLSPAPG